MKNEPDTILDQKSKHPNEIQIIRLLRVPNQSFVKKNGEFIVSFTFRRRRKRSWIETKFHKKMGDDITFDDDVRHRHLSVNEQFVSIQHILH